MRRPAIARANFHADKGGGWWFLHSRSRRHFRSVEVSACFICPEGAKFSYWRSEEPSAFHASSPAASPILAGARGNLASFFCIQGDICCYSGRMIAAISHPWSAGTLIPSRCFVRFRGVQIFYAAGMARCISRLPRPGSLFPSPAAFPRSCAPRLLPALKYARWACLLGKNRI